MTFDNEKKQVESKLHERETYLMPMYHQVALSFANLHDTPVRMYEKACIAEIVPWRTSRQFFYWRLKRRLFENRVKNKIQKVILNKTSDAEASLMIKQWFVDHHGLQNVSLSSIGVCNTNHLFYMFISNISGRKTRLLPSG